MKTFKLFFPLLLLFTASCAGTGSVSHREMIKACSMEKEAARTAVRLRNKGIASSQLRDKLAPLDKNSSRLLLNMHQIVDETYRHKWLNETVYSQYRQELCLRQLQHRYYPLTIEAVLKSLQSCQAKESAAPNESLHQCISNTFDRYTDTIKPKP